MPERHVAFYARVSSESQARDNTIASQVAALRERIAADGGQLEPDHAYADEGFSGSPSSARRWSGCATWWRPGPSRGSMCTPPTGSPAATPTRRC